MFFYIEGLKGNLGVKGQPGAPGAQGVGGKGGDGGLNGLIAPNGLKGQEGSKGTLHPSPSCHLLIFTINHNWFMFIFDEGHLFIYIQVLFW